MATDNSGWNPLKRNPNGAMTDSFDIGDGLKMHDTFNFNLNGDITKTEVSPILLRDHA